jgi:hypothetical protein
MKKILLLTLLAFLAINFYSCLCECRCSKDSGCHLITIKLRANDSLIQGKFCAVSYYLENKPMRDSIANFLKKYESTGTVIGRRDSIYKIEEPIDGLNCDEIKPYTDKGYDCQCAK